MPLYEYRCDTCGKMIEIIQKFSDPPLEQCDCGGELEKILSAPAIQFKGSGWYITDYARKNGSNGSSGKDSSKETSAKDMGSDSSQSGSKNEVKTETKSESKATTSS